MNSFMTIDNNANIQDLSIEYIVPQIVKYQNIDGLLENNKNNHSLFDTNEYILIDDVLQEKFVCIVGEPGIGKSRLVAEIKKKVSSKLYSESASKFSANDISVDTEYCIIDALDEVDGNSFHDALISIKNYKEKNPNVNVIFTCRKHYVASYANQFSVCNKLNYIELLRLKENDVLEIIKNCNETMYQNVSISSKLKELLTIPRYLMFILEYGKKQRECSNVGELFEYVVDSSIQTAINGCQIKNKNLNILIQRVLEKLAFIMEISRKDQITKDELYSILDGIKGNMAQMLIANVDLLFFKNRILKETNGILQFENTEIQEYLAAKELCRQDNIESVLYDIAVQQTLKHIYPNWYDVIPHISYTKDKVSTFINVFKLIVSYESNLENKAFENLLRYVDPSILSLQQKEDLFIILFEHYQRISAYIIWRGPISELLQECYTPSCDAEIMLPLEQLNKLQLSNIYVTIDAIVEENKLSKCVSDYWVNAANDLMATDNNEKKLAALNLYSALKCTDELIQLSRSYSGLSKELKEKYCEITGYKQFVDKNVVDCWLDDCYKSNPYAINAVLCIEDTAIMTYAYGRIFENGKLYNFFNKDGALVVCYELYLKRQFDIAWNGSADSRQLITRMIANFISSHLYTTYTVINAVIKQILLEETIGILFLQCFDNVWDIEEVFRRFDAELIDAGFLSSVEKLLHETQIEDWYINNILTSLVYKIKNDEVKKESVSEYINRYAKIFEQWDKNSKRLEEQKNNKNEQRLLEIFQNLLEPDVSEYYKYEAALELSQNIDFIKRQDSLQPFIDIISKFFDEIDLNKLVLQKTSDNSFSLSKSLVKIPYYVKALYQLGISDLLIAHRDLLTKTLPMICRTSSIDAREIREIYRKIIGSIGENEKVGLIEWWKSREDDFMNISPEDIFTCITDYGIDTLSYKLEEFVEQYTENQENLGRRIAASKALDIISEGYCNWDLDRYKALFNTLVDDSITSVKMQCNAIMIEKFQDSNAIIWRIEYLKNNVVQSLNNDTGHARAISYEESEMISPNPRMFRCFMFITENNLLAEKLLDLFDFGLSLTVNKETQEYSSYLLNQIYLFFVNAANICNISELRKRVEAFNTTHISYLANSIMNGFEMMFLQNEKTNISKAIKLYNKCIEEAHLEIRNNDDLRRYFTYVHSEVQKEIQDQGIYSLVRQNSLSEDFIQRELKNTIINKCCQMGLNAVWVDREVTLQDNKRTDLLIRYGLCNPIMVELKLLHNKEIQNKKQRQEYKKKFIQYTNATNACLSVFWVFKIHRKESDTSAFNSLKAEYKELDNTLVLLTDCKCSSGIETGLPKKQARLKAKK